MENIFEIMSKIDVKQVILQGPPGTSKTHGAKEIIVGLINNEKKKNSQPSISIEVLDNYKLSQKDYGKNSSLKENVYWDMVQFHPSYSYEDFVRGITVSTIPNKDADNEENPDAGKIKYDTVNKIFGQICELAGKKENESKTFFLIIDEINRADVATVFGELIYALEYRGLKNKIATPYLVGNDRDIYVPDNLYIIGTMNTADKSVGTIDMAIRRRFLFVDQLPDIGIIDKCFVEYGKTQEWTNLKEQTKRCFNWLKEIVLNSIRGNYKPKDFMIGHTYFLPDKITKNAGDVEVCIRLKLKYQVFPMLREYAEDRIIEINNIKEIKLNNVICKVDNIKRYLSGDDSCLDAAVKEIFPE